MIPGDGRPLRSGRYTNFSDTTGAHDLVHHRLGELAEDLLDVDEPVLEAREREGRVDGHVCQRGALWYAVHCGHCLSLEPDLW